MGTIKDAAKQVKELGNIADLPEVDVNAPMKDREGTDKDGRMYSFKVALIGENEYRVPNKVLKDVKELMRVKPNLSKFKVTKRGNGLQTSYTVVALD